MFLPKKFVDWMEWFGTLTGIAGAAIIASNIGLVGEGYIVFTFSAISFMVFAWKLKRWPLFIMNIVFLLINAWGIWRWLLLPLV